MRNNRSLFDGLEGKRPGLFTVPNRAGREAIRQRAWCRPEPMQKGHHPASRTLSVTRFGKNGFEEGSMGKTAMIQARIEPELKAEAERTLGLLGLTATQAITLFFRQLVSQQRLPAELTVMNETTRDTFRKTDSGEDLVRCTGAEDMFESLGI